MNTDGMVEVRQGSFCLEPMSSSATDCSRGPTSRSRQSLERWLGAGAEHCLGERDWRLTIEAAATVSGTLRVRYRMETARELAIDAATVRPGASVSGHPALAELPQRGRREPHPRSRLERRRSARQRHHGHHSGERAVGVSARMAFDEGLIAASLRTGGLPGRHEAHDTFGFATGAFEFAISLADGVDAPSMCLDCGPARARVSPDEPAFDWGVQIARAQWAGRGWSASAIEVALTATAHILVTRSGPALAARTSTLHALLDQGRRDDERGAASHGTCAEVRSSYAGMPRYQRADGFVPCCVDRQGADWLVEHDSHGEFIALIADYYRFTRDEALLMDCWMSVERCRRLHRRVAR